MVDSDKEHNVALRPIDFVDIARTPWLLRNATIAFYSIAILAPTVATEYGRLTEPSIPLALTIGGISVAIHGALLFAVRGPIRRWFGRSAASTLLALAIMGAIRGLTTTGIVSLVDAESLTNLVTRTGLGMFTAPIMLSFIAIVLKRVVEARAQRAETQRNIAEAEMVRDVVLDEVNRSDAELLARIDDTLRPAIGEIEIDVKRIRVTRAALAQSLDRLANSVVRPLSHTLARTGSRPPAIQQSLERQAVAPRALTLTEQINPLFSTLGVGLGGFSVMVGAIPAIDAAVAAAVAAVSTFTLLRATQLLLGNRVLRTGYSIVLIAILHELVWVPAQFINNVLVFPDSVVVDFALFGLFTTPILGLLYQVVAFGAQSSRQQLAILESARIDMVLQQSEAKRRAWLRQRHISHTLHSAIQSRIHAQARLLRESPGTLTPAEREETIATLRSILTLVNNDPPAHVDAARTLTELREFWAGMCDIRISLSDDAIAALGDDPEAAEAVSILSLEIVSNAIRHGDARVIDITVLRDSPETVRIVASNDGRGLDPARRAGMGMAIYDELTVSWSIESGDRVTMNAVVAARGSLALA